ncbi:hypothetical protein HYT84_01200 [Candidatus Micrarchaeota archaeon]|nr:hypothetical protein [Candidatus Micrarchaeota archaeon]
MRLALATLVLVASCAVVSRIAVAKPPSNPPLINVRNASGIECRLMDEELIYLDKVDGKTRQINAGKVAGKSERILSIYCGEELTFVLTNERVRLVPGKEDAFFGNGGLVTLEFQGKQAVAGVVYHNGKDNMAGVLFKNGDFKIMKFTKDDSVHVQTVQLKDLAGARGVSVSTNGKKDISIDATEYGNGLRVLLTIPDDLSKEVVRTTWTYGPSSPE